MDLLYILTVIIREARIWCHLGISASSLAVSHIICPVAIVCLGDHVFLEAACQVMPDHTYSLLIAKCDAQRPVHSSTAADDCKKKKCW